MINVSWRNDVRVVCVSGLIYVEINFVIGFGLYFVCWIFKFLNSNEIEKYWCVFLELYYSKYNLDVRFDVGYFVDIMINYGYVELVWLEGYG